MALNGHGHQQLPPSASGESKERSEDDGMGVTINMGQFSNVLEVIWYKLIQSAFCIKLSGVSSPILTRMNHIR